MLLDCSCLVADLHRVFSLYWQLQYKEFVPSLWSKKLSALTSRDQNLRLQLDDTEAQVYISVSPRLTAHTLLIGGERSHAHLLHREDCGCRLTDVDVSFD